MEDSYIHACDLLKSGKNLSEAKSIFEHLKKYKESEKKLESVKRKQVKKLAILLLIFYVVSLVVGIVAKIKALTIVSAIGGVITLLGLPSAFKK